MRLHELYGFDHGFNKGRFGDCDAVGVGPGRGQFGHGFAPVGRCCKRERSARTASTLSLAAQLRQSLGVAGESGTPAPAMSGRKQDKRPTSGGADLNVNPFAGLEGVGLASGNLRKPASVSSPSLKGGRVEVRREKAGRGGKTVTTLSAFQTHHTQRDLDLLLKELKQCCACGGSRKERVLELQGDERERVCAALTARGFKPVLAGG